MCPDLKPENVLICIEDVETVIRGELAASQAASSTPPTRLVGVPPSKGRGGNQTPRSESVFITGSQPLPSPSSSFGSSPMLDKLAFTMSKIDNTDEPVANGLAVPEKKGPATVKRGVSLNADAVAEGVNNVTLESKASFVGRVPGAPGPSLLSQQAPAGAGPSGLSQTKPAQVSPEASGSGSSPGEGEGLPGSVMSIDQRSVHSAEEEEGDLTERITVKIADLGNGACDRSLGVERMTDLLYSDMGRAPFHRRHSDQTVSVSRSHLRSQVGAKRRHVERCLRGVYQLLCELCFLLI